MKFTEEEQYYFEELASGDYWQVLVKALEMGIERRKEDVLSTEVNTNDRAIAFNKARLEGAQALAAFIVGLARKRKKKD